MARRVVRDAPDRLLRDELKLVGWVSKVEDRRRVYFGWCDDVLTTLGGLTEDDEPSDDSVVVAVGLALRADDSFTTHVARRKDATYFLDPENWEQIYRVGAGTIYHEYLVAKEKHEWPEAGPF